MNGMNQRFVHAQKWFLANSKVIGFGLGLSLLTACNPPASDQHLQDQAAQATETAKQQSAEALAQARVAAANAERAVNDVAAGVKQGLNTKTPAGGASRIDLNSASETDLASLPGISVGKAKRIIEHRPYTSSHDLVKSGLMTEDQFDQIAPRVTVQ
jgi:DNA uptake protein ComE-like DNA-binding protein